MSRHSCALHSCRVISMLLCHSNLVRSLHIPQVCTHKHFTFLFTHVTLFLWSYVTSLLCATLLSRFSYALMSLYPRVLTLHIFLKYVLINISRFFSLVSRYSHTSAAFPIQFMKQSDVDCMQPHYFLNANEERRRNYEYGVREGEYNNCKQSYCSQGSC